MSVRLAVRQWGEPGAEPVVLVHGFLGRADDWEPVARRLGDGHHVTAVDLPGHGASADVSREAYTLHGAADAVAAVMDREGPETASVVGYSMGGRVAYHVAMRHPGRVRALVAVSAHPGLATTEERDRRLREDHERAVRIRGDFRRFLDSWYRNPMFGSVAFDARERQALVDDRLRGSPPALARALEGLGTGHQVPVGKHLVEAGVPALLVAGSEDARYVDLLADLAGRTGAELRVVESAGHIVHRDAPGEVAALVSSFIQRSTRPHHVRS